VSDRRFLLLQGPHGPFFAGLARMLSVSGAEVWRVGFTGGDRAFWRDGARYIPYRGTLADWPAALREILDARGITDVVLYGDTRPLHAQAVTAARACGLSIHVFEEGYLRPYWVTYERGGSNGNSRLMTLGVAQMRAALARHDSDLAEAPASWGDLREHMVYGALYHGFVLLGARAYPAYRPHREITLAAEFRLHLRRLMMMPLHRLERWRATRRIERGGFPYHLVMLQLDHDASFRAHGPFRTTPEFLAFCTEAFAAGARAHHHLVFKAHPLDDDRVPLAREIARLACEHDVEGRVHFVRGGKLARLLGGARSAITVNSTAAQQALWRGLPLRAFGAAVYAKPEFVSTQALRDFLADPQRPDSGAYRDFRRFLLETSQVPGGFYSARGRRQLLRRVVDMMLSPADPYDVRLQGSAAPRQQLRIVP
jgi:capsular polysaccharide export protein